MEIEFLSQDWQMVAGFLAVHSSLVIMTWFLVLKTQGNGILIPLRRFKKDSKFAA